MAHPPNPRADLLRRRIDVWNRTHQNRQIDPAAELAVAAQEGLGGGIGDNGTSFGPNQLHYGGAYPQSAPHGAQASHQWAWSPAGIDYALGQVANVAGGQHGRQAVESIVSRFERPANPGREIANALAAYDGSSAAPAASWGTSTAPAASWGTAQPPAPDGRRRLLLELAGSVGEKQPDFTSVLQQLLERRAPAAAPPMPSMSPSAPTAAPAYTGGVLAELLHEGVGGPTHSTGDHIHVALTDPNAMLAAIHQAQALGLSVRENPYVDPVDPVHAPHSFHKRNFPGLFNGRKLGEALDVSGPKELAFQSWVKSTYGGR